MNQQGTDAYEIWAGAFGAPHPFAVQQLQLVASVSDDRPLQFCTTAVERANGVLSSKCFDPADQRASVLLASSESKNPRLGQQALPSEARSARVSRAAKEGGPLGLVGLAEDTRASVGQWLETSSGFSCVCV